MSRYDRAVTVFSPSGELLQVQYAQEAVKKCSAAVGVRGSDSIVLAVEKKLVAEMQENRTEKKIVPLDDHVALVFSGLRADARVLISRLVPLFSKLQLDDGNHEELRELLKYIRSQIECQSYRLTVEDSVTIEYIARYIAGVKQMYTQLTGLRPFGVSCIVGGFDYDGSPQLYQTEPSGLYHGWKACSTGRCNGTVLEFLEKHYSPKTVETETGTIRLALRALMKASSESVQKNLEVAVLKRDVPMQMLEAEAINNIVAEIQKAKAEEKNKKQKK